SGSPMLVITNLDNNSTEYINEVSLVNTGIDPLDYIGTCCILQKLIHPEDYTGFLEHLIGIKEGEEKEIMVRVEAGGSWTDYCFKNHLYNWSSTGDSRKAILSLGYKLPDINIERDEDEAPCDDFSIKEPVPDAYIHLLNSLDESFCIIELIYDREGKPVDYLRSEEHTSELQSRENLVCRLLLEKKKQRHG